MRNPTELLDAAAAKWEDFPCEATANHYLDIAATYFMLAIITVKEFENILELVGV